MILGNKKEQVNRFWKEERESGTLFGKKKEKVKWFLERRKRKWNGFWKEEREIRMSLGNKKGKVECFLG